ncbi:hypothetical protein DXG01_000461 [Tephrocybe rancida]|nr:hypothetical protein DXG01_000461 [Tephrocybe rancida]
MLSSALSSRQKGAQRRVDLQEEQDATLAGFLGQRGVEPLGRRCTGMDSSGEAIGRRVRQRIEEIVDQTVTFTQHTGTGLNNGPLHAEHPVKPLQAIQNAVVETLPAPKRAKTVPLAVPGTGLTEKNFAMRKWLKSNAGGLKVDFETYFKGISPAEKKDFEAEVKKVKKDASAVKLAQKKLAASQAT